MKITLYHEIDPASKDTVLEQGIVRDAAGEKTDASKEMVDGYLDEHMPEAIQDQGEISRESVVYAYLENDGGIIDIQNGGWVSVEEFAAESDQVLLSLTVDVDRCYVSDLDAYDMLEDAMQQNEEDDVLEHLAARYWQQVMPLQDFTIGEIRRPEVMITEDVSPEDIEVVKVS